MKFRLGLLICGAVFMAAGPVWADHAANPDTLKDFGSREGSMSGGGSSSFGVGATSDMGISARSFSGVESEKFGYSPATNWIRASREPRFGEGVPNIPPVAEPGSLSLILLGLASVGMFFCRRGDLGSTGLLRE